MKGVDLAVTLIILVIIGFVVVLVAYFMLAPLTGTASSQEISATLTACCTRFVMDGFCQKNDQGNYAAFEDIDCAVDKKIDSSGFMKITALAGKSGYAATRAGVQKACCK
ncbi:MAG: hypothetical protein QXU82_01440 [Candidatus Aenigmatarchaeota archaeon]